MEFLTVIQVLVYIFISFFLGSSFIRLSINPEEISIISYYFHSYLLSDFTSRLIVFLAGLLVILLCLRYIQSLVLIQEKTITYPSGNITITLSAIEDMLKNILEERTDISRVRPKIILKKKGFDVIVRCNLNGEENLAILANELQEKIMQKLNSLFGTEEQVRVKIKIRKVSFGGKPLAEEDEETTIPFRNYNY